MKAITKNLWAPLVTGGRKPWIYWSCIRSTRRDAKEAFTLAIKGAYAHEWLAKTKFVKVSVATTPPATQPAPVQETVAHCEAGPEHCQQCYLEGKNT